MNKTNISPEGTLKQNQTLRVERLPVKVKAYANVIGALLTARKER